MHKYVDLYEHYVDRLQCSLAHQLLPKEQHTKPEEVYIILVSSLAD